MLASWCFSWLTKYRREGVVVETGDFFCGRDSTKVKCETRVFLSALSQIDCEQSDKVFFSIVSVTSCNNVLLVCFRPRDFLRIRLMCLAPASTARQYIRNDSSTRDHCSHVASAKVNRAASDINNAVCKLSLSFDARSHQAMIKSERGS